MEVSFREIRRRLDREGTIAYEGVPFGEGAGDAPERRDSHRRRVRIQAQDLPGCRVKSAGPPTRLVTKMAPGGDEAAPRSRFRWEDGGLVGEITDLVMVRGYLYDEQALARGKFHVTNDRHAVTAPRTVRGVVPPFTEAAEASGGLGGFLLRAGDEESDLPDLVQGLAFLAIQGDLGLALLEAPGYGDWARQRIQYQRERQADELLAEYGDQGPVSAAARVAVRRAFLERPLAAAEVRSLLAEWLGDLRAIDLATSLEAHAAEELLACREAAAGGAACGDEVRRRLEVPWRRLLQLFPPPTRVRIKVPLVPFHDREREVFGFYRILLPQPVEGGVDPPDDAIPPLPAGFELLRQRLGEEDGALSLAAAGVEKIDYRKPTRFEHAHLRDWLYRSEGAVITRDQAPLTVVEVVVEGPGEGASPKSLRGYLFEERWKPEPEREWRLCTRLDGATGGFQCTVVGSLSTNGAI
jgi:hypothetical protein